MTDYERQIELEISMAGLGAERFQSAFNKNMEAGRGTSTAAGNTLVKNAVRPLSDAITHFVEGIYAGKVGRRATAAILIHELDINAVSLVVTRVILNKLLSKKKVAFTMLALQVANAVEDEARFTSFERDAGPLFKTIERKAEGEGADIGHKRRVLTYAMGKYDIPWDRWGRTDKLQLGWKMIELFCDVTGLAEVVQGAQSADKHSSADQYLVQLTEKCAKWVEASALKGTELAQFFMPTVIPPKPWEGLSGGGYWSNAIRPLSLVKRARKEHRELLKTADLSVVYKGLNAIQNTAWQINPQVLAVMREYISLGSTYAGLVPLEDIPLPNKPHDIDTNEQAAKEWRWAARDIHNDNYQRKLARKGQCDLMELVKRFEHEPRIYFPHNVDFRGRAYPIPNLLHPQGTDVVKGLLRFADGVPLGDDGARWLMIHGANCYGVDKVSFDDRVKWVRDHTQLILWSAEDPIANRWWTEADSPWCFLAFCFEFRDGMIANGKGEEFVSRIPVALDGSCNGLQHFSAMLRDTIGGKAVNLTNSPTPQDIYQRVADVATAKLRLIASTVAMDDPLQKKDAPTPHDKKRWAEGWVYFGLNRKLTKRPVMVLPYGGTPRSCYQYVGEAVAERIKGGQDHNFGDELKKATGYLSSTVWDSIGDVVVAARQAMEWLQHVSRQMSKANRPLIWKTPSGFIAYQDIRDMRCRRVKTKLHGKVIYPKLYDETDNINGAKQATSVSPNFVHSYDAAAMFLTLAMLVDAGVTSFAMIHDSYGTHAGRATWLANALRQAFVTMYQGDALSDFLSMMDTDDLEIKPRPPMGDLDITEVLNAAYFFA
ncbi:DNA-directed RNA polymerase [Rhizobium sp. BK376]|uniref:DNA-directed RNA polymerase n=1 Tax=Rhizobium sp. BK376 TaxID=2512149 RepID=UPI00104CE7E7|nr:DNA-directed RNA polymerase [Rhizobium sp. BK376]TCR92610.1 DNA-directed RNA polymerase [Rhizobium sp. BK376]